MSRFLSPLLRASVARPTALAASSVARYSTVQLTQDVYDVKRGDFSKVSLSKVACLAKKIGTVV